MNDKISKHFKRSEFACKCGCGFDAVDHELLSILESIRRRFDAPVIITSGCRCAKHNSESNGKPESQHLLGKAVDIVVSGVSSVRVVKFLESEYPNRYGIGLYSDWVHVDCRATKARW